MAYTARHALIDLRFINRYFYDGNYPKDWGMVEILLDTLNAIEDYATRGRRESLPEFNNHADFLFKLGGMRGLLWNHPISQAVSDAINRVVEFVTRDDLFPCELLDGWRTQAEAPEDRLSDGQRGVIAEAAINGEDIHDPKFAASVGATHRAVLELDRWWGASSQEEVEEALAQPVEQMPSDATADEAEPPVQVPTRHPFNPNGLRGQREWTEEQRQAQAERAREYHRSKPPLIPDSDFDDVKADFDAGLSAEKIGKKRGCSGGTVRNFLKRHGVDPRRSIIQAAAEQRPVEVSLPETRREDGDTSGGQVHPTVCVVSVKPDVFRMLTTPPPADEPSEVVITEMPADVTTWDHKPIDSDDWPDVQKMLVEGRSREAIAGDYDVSVEELNRYIEERIRQTRERYGLGE